MTFFGGIEMELEIVKENRKLKKYIKQLQDEKYILSLDVKRLITENNKLTEQVEHYQNIKIECDGIWEKW